MRIVDEEENETCSDEDDESDISDDDFEIVFQKPKKTVRFENNVRVLYFREVSNAHRRGCWAEDAMRFRRKCETMNRTISFVFEMIHRERMRTLINMSFNLRSVSNKSNWLVPLR